jgi:hypothetical protein
MDNTRMQRMTCELLLGEATTALASRYGISVPTVHRHTKETCRTWNPELVGLLELEDEYVKIQTLRNHKYELLKGSPFTFVSDMASQLKERKPVESKSWFKRVLGM